MCSIPRRLPAIAFAMIALFAAAGLGACSDDPAIDEAFPPGNPVLGEDLGDDPVVGSDGAGGDDRSGTDYVLLSVLALCLIGAGLLLVRVERWERRRSAAADG